MFLSRRNFLGWGVAGLLPLRDALALQRAARSSGAGEMNERYFRNRSEGLRLSGSGKMMTALL